MSDVCVARSDEDSVTSDLNKMLETIVLSRTNASRLEQSAIGLISNIVFALRSVGDDKEDRAGRQLAAFQLAGNSLLVGR